MGLFERFRLGNGALKPKLRAELESEGLVLAAEGLRGTIRYDRFRAPGKRFHKKVSGERLAIALSEERFVVFCRSGSVELIDSAYANERLHALEVSLEGDDEVALRVDYDRLGQPSVSGAITIRAKTDRAAEIVEQLRARLGRR
jgi:hypothetical protein